MRSKDKSGGSYEVGYGKPPIRSRFKPGQCGNPAGRPKGSRNRASSEAESNRLLTIISEEANRMIAVQGANGKKKMIETKRAVTRSITMNALKGQHRSQRLFVQLVDESERIQKEQREATFLRWAKYKQDWEPQFRSPRPPNHLPHPDDVLLDFETGTITIAGPLTKQEKASWDRWRNIRTVLEDELKELVQLREDPEFEDVQDVMITGLIPAAEETLWAIGLALGGSRSVMKFLERTDLSAIEARLGKTKIRRKRAEYIFAIIHGAMYKKYREESHKRGYIPG